MDRLGFGEEAGISLLDELKPAVLDQRPDLLQRALDEPALLLLTDAAVVARIGDDALEGRKGQIAILELA